MSLSADVRALRSARPLTGLTWRELIEIGRASCRERV